MTQPNVNESIPVVYSVVAGIYVVTRYNELNHTILLSNMIENGTDNALRLSNRQAVDIAYYCDGRVVKLGKSNN